MLKYTYFFAMRNTIHKNILLLIKKNILLRKINTNERNKECYRKNSTN